MYFLCVWFSHYPPFWWVNVTHWRWLTERKNAQQLTIAWTHFQSLWSLSQTFPALTLNRLIIIVGKTLAENTMPWSWLPPQLALAPDSILHCYCLASMILIIFATWQTWLQLGAIETAIPATKHVFQTNLTEKPQKICVIVAKNDAWCSPIGLYESIALSLRYLKYYDN